MTRLTFAAAAAVLLFAGSASANVVADFQLNGSLANGAGGGATLTNNGAVQTPTGLAFGFNEGPTISGLGTLSAYTLETRFSFDAVNGYRRIADWSGRASDDGLYVLNGDIDFYNQAFGPAGQITAGDLFTVTLTRDASSLVNGYINGILQFSFNDVLGEAIINDSINLFIDDLIVPNEASRGFVDYVTISNDGAVPEPAAWALMLVGFGTMGAMLRRRRQAFA